VVWHTGKWLVPGQVVYSPRDHTPYLHSHRSFLRGMWAFAASPEDLGLTLDLLERTPEEPRVAEGWAAGIEDIDLCWIPRHGQQGAAKQALMDRVSKSVAGMEALRCWFEPDDEDGDGGRGGGSLLHIQGTDTSPSFPKAWQQGWVDSWYDRAGEVQCNDAWAFEAGDSYTIVAINGLDPRLDEDGGWADPNLQHVSLKLAYETFGDTPGPNLEIWGSLSTVKPSERRREGLAPGGEIKGSFYALPLSYLGVLSDAADPDAFLRWYREEANYTDKVQASSDAIDIFSEKPFNIDDAIFDFPDA